jgi:hypothetical protein
VVGRYFSSSPSLSEELFKSCSGKTFCMGLLVDPGGDTDFAGV